MNINVVKYVRYFIWHGAESFITIMSVYKKCCDDGWFSYTLLVCLFHNGMSHLKILLAVT